MAQEGASERACDRCRERRVKCDKRHPTCFRCEKLGQPCPGYTKKRKFVDEGVGLRKKYHFPSLNADSSGKYPGLGPEDSADYTTSSTFQAFVPRSNATDDRAPPRDEVVHHECTASFPSENAEDVAIDGIPQQQSPTLDGTTMLPISELARQDENDILVDDILNDPSFDPEWFDIDPLVFYGSGGNSCGFLPNIPNIVDEVDRDGLIQTPDVVSDTPHSRSTSYRDTTLWAAESQLNTSAIITDEREHEMAYLIRHFTEAIGPWMDLFDQDKHFGNLVPLKALRDALLRNAIAAVAAKQLGRVKGTKPYLGKQCQKAATMEVMDGDADIDWFYKAANYYDKAIAFSRVYLQAISGSLSNPPSPDTQTTASMANSDDLLVAVSIFSLYESLDNVDTGWLQHLAGLKTLLSAVSAEQQSQTMHTVPAITVGRRASFWNFARADYQAAYINHQHTYLSTGDIDLWRNCGLQIREDGPLYDDPDKIRNDPSHYRETAGLVAHTLLWLVLRVMNYLASDQDATPVRQTRWLRVTAQLDEWYASLPQTFQHCTQIRYPLSKRGASPLTEVFFSINVCAATIQLYHFARILLLLNRPTDANGPSPTKKAHQKPPSEAVAHARQIIGIAIGRPPPSVRVEMVLTLYIAGLCLESNEERHVVFELLHAIEQDTGCSTERRCAELAKAWGWGQGPFAATAVV